MPCSVWEVSAVLGNISIADNIYIVTRYTDMRKSIDGLFAIILNQMKTEPDSHAVYLFCGKRCDRIKVLLREPDGHVLLYKGLDVVRGKYRWPRNSSSVFPSDTALLKALFLSTFEATKKWATTIRNWVQVYGKLSIMYEGRFPE